MAQSRHANPDGMRAAARAPHIPHSIVVRFGFAPSVAPACVMYLMSTPALQNLEQGSKHTHSD